MSGLDELSKGLYGIAAHRELPEGEEFGASFVIGGEAWIVTQREVDRVKNLPTIDEVRAMVAGLNRTGWVRP